MFIFDFNLGRTTILILYFFIFNIYISSFPYLDFFQTLNYNDSCWIIVKPYRMSDLIVSILLYS